MRIELLSLTLTLAALTACAGARKTARVEPLAPPVAPLVAERLELARPSSLEPLGCPIYAGDDRPDYDSQGLDCLVKWLREARTYLDDGGAPTAHTNAAAIEKNRALALKLAARTSNWLKNARFDTATAKPRAKTASAVELKDALESQQRYLNGVVYFQKGDYAAARVEWLLAKKLNPSNTDAKAGLAMLDKLDAGL